MKEYTGCVIEHRASSLLLSQPHLIKPLHQRFDSFVGKHRTYATPLGTHDTIIRPQSEDEKLSEEDQKQYRSGVGMLLYLLKHSRPDLSNSARELSKVMDGATKAHQKLLYRVIKYVFDTEHWKLKLEPISFPRNSVHIEAFCDSDYSGDRDTRISVSGFIIFVNGCPISWRSRGQRSVTLSSTEAEYVAISEVCTEIMFVKQVLEFLGLNIHHPITVRVDNVGAIYLTQNHYTGGRTKHVDIRYHYVRELIEQGIIEIVFVKSEDNKADIFTKNVKESIHTKLTDSYIMKNAGVD